MPFSQLSDRHNVTRFIRVGDLFRSPGDPTLGQVVHRDLNGHLVARQDLDEVHSELARNMSGYNVLVRQLNLNTAFGRASITVPSNSTTSSFGRTIPP